MSLRYTKRHLAWLPAVFLGFFGAELALAPSTASADGAIYVVQPGDTLSHLSARYSVNVADWVRANGLANPNFLSIGQELVIPSPSRTDTVQGGGTPQALTAPAAPAIEAPAAPAAQTSAGVESVYQVARGDTLWGIALRHDVRAYDIQIANGLADANYIVPGQVLTIPSGTYAPPAPRHGAPLVAPQPISAAEAQAGALTGDAPWLTADYARAPMFKLTHYCLYGNMASGRYVYPTAVAADKSVFPIGTKLVIEGLSGVFTVEDRFAWDAGENRLDLWIPTCDEAIQRGVQYRRALRVEP